jgi:hypothetical protein
MEERPKKRPRRIDFPEQAPSSPLGKEETVLVVICLHVGHYFCKELEEAKETLPTEGHFFCRLTKRKWAVLNAVLSSAAHTIIELWPNGINYNRDVRTRPFLEVHRSDIKTVLHSDTDAEAYAALERTLREDVDTEPKDYTFRILLS